MKRLFYQWVPRDCEPPKWMAFSHRSIRRKLDSLYVAFPLNLVVAAAYWINDKWAEKANEVSWIEREVEARRNFDEWRLKERR